MPAILGHTEASQTHGCGCGCGCGCGHDSPMANAIPVQLTTAPAHLPHVTGDARPSTSARFGDLDVRALPHGQRHEIIFARLDALTPGDALG